MTATRSPRAGAGRRSNRSAPPGRSNLHRRARLLGLDPGGAAGGRAGARSEGRRILVADDEHTIRLLCRVNLRVEGMEVLEAPDGEQAVAIARRELPDLLLLDVMMPGLDGWAVARALAADETTSAIPIVFLTARAEQADRLRARELGGVGYILKPFDPVTLAETVETILARIARGERAQLVQELVEST